MSENTLLYQAFVSRKLSEAESLQLASACLSYDPRNRGDTSSCSAVCLLVQQLKQFELAVYCAAAAGDAGDDGVSSTCDKSVTFRYYPEHEFYSINLVLFDAGNDPSLRLLTNSSVIGNEKTAFISDIRERIVNLLDSIGVLIKVDCLLQPITRGAKLWNYLATSDGRLYEAIADRLVVDMDSPYQNIKIYHSQLHGNVLYLDEDVMFSEADQEAYTRALLGLQTGQPKRNNFADKEILILGGGDGGVICELLKQKPKMVVMCDIDEEVLKLSSKYLRSVCGDVFDSYEAENKKIIIGDCLQHLHECIQSGKQYDFIVNDLTEFPVNKEERGWTYDLATDNCQVLELSLKALKPTGRYLSRGSGLANEKYWKLFEADCSKLGCAFQSVSSHVPSFYEEYKLYEVWRQNQ